MSEHMKVIEINGVKIEIDMRNARVIDNFRVGDNVKVLIKDYDTYRSYPGVIVGFDQFENLPTIIIAYMKIEYSGAELKFEYFNTESKYEVCKIDSFDIGIEKDLALTYMDREIAKAESTLTDLKRKKAYFLRHFEKYFKQVMEN